jgi:hypothetical protein
MPAIPERLSGYKDELGIAPGVILWSWELRAKSR